MSVSGRSEPIRQREVVTELGDRAIDEDDVGGLLADAVADVAAALAVDVCTIFELREDHGELRLGHATGLEATDGVSVNTDGASLIARSLAVERPVVVDDLAASNRVETSGVPRADVTGGVAVPIGPSDDPWGVLGVHATDGREFDEFEVSFLEAVANALASAVETDRLERELEDERKLKERIVEASSAGIAVVDVDGEFRFVDDTAQEMLGRNQEEIASASVEDPDWDFVDPRGEPLSIDRTPMERIAATGEPLTGLEFGVRQADGTRVWLSMNGIPLRDDNGDVTGGVFSLEDITDPHELESELEEIYGRISDAFFALDGEWNFTYLNERAHELINPEGGKLEGTPIWDQFPEATDRSFKAGYERAMREQETVSFEEYYPEPLDAWFEVRAYPSETGLSVYFRDVTERKEREHELEQYETIVETIDDGVYVVDGDQRFTMVNDAYADMLGYDREDLIGEHVSLVVGDDAIEQAHETESALQKGATERTSMEANLETASGETLPAEATFALLSTEKGRERHVAVVRDVSDRREREQQRRQFETLFKESRDVNAVLDPKGNFQYLPPSTETVIGYDPDDLLGQETFQYVHPDDQEEVMEDFARMVEDPDYRPTNEFRFRHADGHWIWLEASGKNLLDDPDIEGLVAYTRDVTDRVERERELRRTERRFEAIFEDPNILVGLLEPDGTVLDINGTAMEYVDADLEAVTGKLFWETPWWGEGDGIQSEVREWTERAAEGEYVDFEADLTRPDGEEYTLSGVFRPVTDEDGEVVSIVVSDRDVSERKRRERELAESERRYRTLAEHFPNGLVTLYDHHLQYTLAAGKGFDRISAEPDDLVGSSVRDVWDETTADALVPAFEAVFEGEERTVELAYEGRDWIVHAVPITDEHDEVFAGMTMAQDVTEQKERERELRDAKSQLEAATEAGAVGTWEWDVTDDRFVAGPTMARIFGVDPDAARDGVPLERFGSAVHEADRERVQREIDEALEGCEDFESEYRVRDPVGEQRWVVARGSVECDEDGDPETFTGAITDITDRKRAELQLKRNNEQLETLFEVLPVGVVVADAGGQMLEANDTAREIWGGEMFDAESVTEYEKFPVWDPDTGERVDPEDMSLARVLDGEEVTDPDFFEIENFDGERRFVRAEGMPVRDETGDVTRGVVTITDVTERRETQRKLEESERRYRTLAEHFPNGAVGVYDRDLRYTLAAGEALGDTLPSADRLEGDCLPDIFPAETAEDLAPMYRAAVEDGETDSTTTTFGGRHWRVWATPLRDADGEIFAGLSFAQDVTEQIERERELERYETIVEVVNDGVYVVDDDGAFTMVNESHAEMLGYDREELIGTHASKVVDDDVIERVEDLQSASAEEGQERPVMEGEVITADGDRIPAEATFATLPEDDAWHRVGVVRDITERKQRERELERAHDLLDRTQHISNVGGWEIDVDTMEVYWTDHTFDLLGVAGDEEPPLDEALDMYHEADRQIVQDAVDDALEHGDSFDIEVRVRTGGGEIRWLRLQGVPETRDGEVVSLRGAAQDVTERKEREQQIEESERQYRTLVENFPNGSVALFDENLRYTVVGGQLLDAMDMDPEDRMGDSIRELHPDSFVEQIEPHFRRALAGESDDFEVDFRGRHLQAHTLPVRNADDEIFAGMLVVQDVTDQVERERELERALDLLNRTERIADVAGWEVDPETEEPYWSEHLFDILDVSYDHQPSLDEALDVYQTDEDRAIVEKAVQDALDTGEPFDVEVLFPRPAGDVGWLRVRGDPVVQDGEVVSLRGAVQDVTERKQRERQIEESERRYRTLVENFPNGAVGLFDADLEYTAVGGQMLDKVGVAMDDRVGESVHEIYPDEIIEEVEPYFDAALEGESNSFEVEFHDRHLHAYTHPVRDSNDQVLAGMLVVQDVTDRREYERELERRTRQQQVVADLGQLALELDDLDDLMHEAASKVAAVLDNDYCKVLDLDPETEELLLRQGVGWQEGIVGQATVSSVEADSQAAYTLANEDPVVVEDLETETRFSGPDLLTSHDVHSGISTIIGSYDEPWGILGTHDTARREFSDEDVNFVQSVANVLAEAIERRRYQKELEELVAELEESNERLEQFAYAASHDLQEPLRMVSSYLQLIERRYTDELDEDGEEFLEFAVDGADRMRNMIDALLQYSRVDTRGDPFEPTDLNEILEDTMDSLQVKIAESDAEITAESLPTVQGDAGQLGQVFQNLLDNAIEYSGDEDPHIEVSAERLGNTVRVSVSDEGIGIDPDDADRVFDVFQSLHDQYDHDGTGIGLALCERIVERHGGDIWVESEPGVGSTFSFTLPASGEHDE